MTVKRMERAREELKRRRAAILEAARMAEAEVAALRTEDRGAELEEVAQAEQGLVDLGALGDAERAELARVDAALARIDEGGYGTCADCGRAIERRRLEALPWAIRCAPCAEAVERQAR